MSDVNAPRIFPVYHHESQGYLPGPLRLEEAVINHVMPVHEMAPWPIPGVTTKHFEGGYYVRIDVPGNGFAFLPFEEVQINAMMQTYKVNSPQELVGQRIKVMYKGPIGKEMPVALSPK